MTYSEKPIVNIKHQLVMIRPILWLFILLLPLSSYTQSTEDTLIIAYTPASPFIIENDGQIEGISVWLWEKCAKELNIPYKFKSVPLKEMLSELKTEAFDVSINPLTITSNRLRDMHFTHSFFASHSVIAKGHMSTLQRILNFLKSFFSLNFLSAFLGLMTLIFLFAFLIWHYERKVNPENFREGWKGLWDGLWWSVVTMTTVGYGDKTPLSKGGKLVALIWMFSGLLFISGLTASVASSLTVDQLHSQSVNFEDFKKKTVGTIQHSSSEQYLKDNFFKDIQLYEKVTAGLDDLVAHKLDAFIYDESIIKYQVKQEEKYQKLDILPQKYKVQFYAFALPKKHQALRNLISNKIVEITERNEWQVVLNEYGCAEE